MFLVPCGFPENIVVTFALLWRHWRLKVLGTSVHTKDKVPGMAGCSGAMGVCCGAHRPKSHLCAQMMEGDCKHQGQNGQHFQWTDRDVWSMKKVPIWQSSTFTGMFISMLFCFCLLVWSNSLRNLKNLNCFNVKYKMWLIFKNLCVSTSSLTLKRQKASFISQPA